MDSASETTEDIVTANGERIVEKIHGSKRGQPKDRRPVHDGRQNPAAGANPSFPPYEPSKPRVAQRRRSYTRLRPEVRMISDTESDLELPCRHQQPRATGIIHHDTSFPRRYPDNMHSPLTKLDLEILLQQKQIDRLEEDLHRFRLSREEKNRHLAEDGREFEDEISERLRRLNEWERKEARTTRAERRTEEQAKIRRLEKAELQAKRKGEIKAALREKEWKEMKKKVEEEETRRRIEKELRDEEFRRKSEERERLIQENRIRRAAVEDYKLAEEQRLLEEERQKRQLRKEYRAAIEAELGYSLEQVKDILAKAGGKKGQTQRRGRNKQISAAVHDAPSGDEADEEAP
ncbi:hypothetical protein CBS147321_8784 [Aspergillus niger]|uniref:uncharacterized protein n=1 Tax=Aspergillus lacticoffeatus (strain CBS 101883) TaxID=1450533 RepID=UPI000D7F78DE|nr:uncharacterized protein BO96DRAFT_416871 [Aspergillus niger CBS 101883]KAI2889599.1 hypothetical protein CBS11852_6793 [Aspergillus niger]KAI2935762.1 hypothetical protein CBS147321_8784 [Aspergillus niger]PYH50767.1 hypothetical protein BO96DRAFT_416871 [Aspergillus niger CBS 101883]GJP91564.1 acyl-coenzyme A:6-aminopenicillanic acid acyl-transferase family protein [Aspergillus niger]